jgi:hypothetical protein
MPAIISSTAYFDSSEKYYYIDLGELTRVFPHMERGKELRCYVVELRDETGKLVRRFKPFKELVLKTSEYFSTSSNKLLPCIVIPEDVATQINIGDNYRVTIVITAYNGKPFLPFELKLIGYDAQKVFENFSRIEATLLSQSLRQPVLNKAVSYLWDAYARLEENDVEGARASVRNSLSTIRDEFIPKTEVVEEAKDFPKNLENLVKHLAEFTHYGGPHPGPAPRTTTEMIILMTIELVRHLAKMLEDKTISLKTIEEQKVIV